MLSAPDASTLDTLPLADSERELLGYYVSHYPRPLPTERVIGQLWQLDPAGGPSAARSGISVRVHNINRALRPLGWHIKRHGHSSRQLVRLDA